MNALTDSTNHDPPRWQSNPTAAGQKILRIWFVWILLMSCVWGVVIAAPPVVVVDDSFEFRYLRSELEFLEDAEGSLTLEDVLATKHQARFEQQGQTVFNRGSSNSIFWLRFRVHNPHSQPKPLTFSIENDYGKLQLYEVSPNQQSRLLFDKSVQELVSAGHAKWEFHNAQFIVPAESNPTYYLRISPNLILRAEISLSRPEIQREHFIVKHNLLSMSWGFISSSALLSLLVFLFVRDSMYFFYTTHLLLFLFHRMLARSWGLSEFPNLDVANWTRVLLAALLVVNAILFLSRSLNLRQKHPWAHRIFQGILLLYLVTSVVAVNLEARLAFNIFMIIGGLGIIVMLAVIYFIWRTGQPHVFFYFVGLGIVGLSTLITSQNAIGWLNFSIPVYFIVEIAALLESILFSIALAFQVFQNFQDRQSYQEQLLKQMKETDRFKDRFLANTSHELKTPLQGMIGLSENLLREARQRSLDPMVETTNLLVQSGKRLNHLINNLLDLTALQSRGLNLHLEPVSLKPLLDSAILLIQTTFSPKHLRIYPQLPTDLPPIQADAARLEQVLLNLLHNACKFTAQGRIEIKTQVQAQQLRIEIHDSGVGVPSANRDRIFQAFEQSQATSSDGIGLGLTISKEIIEEHQGEIGVEDSPLGGACFWFSLPLAETPPLLSHQDIEPTADTSAFTPQFPVHQDSGRARILIVDDDPVTLHLLAGLLSETEWSCLCSSSGAEALEFLSSGVSIDLVLLDVMMPEMDGIELCKHLRQRYSKEELPILFLTALGRAEDLTQAFEAGGNDYLTKPILKSELQARISSQLELVHLRQQSNTPMEERNLPLREHLAQTMQLVLRCWEESMGKDSIHLAQESKLWGAYLDKTNGVWRSPSIRQYLSASTMPPRPRWRKVAQTVEFLLSQLSPNDPHRPELEAHLLYIYEKTQQESASS